MGALSAIRRKRSSLSRTARSACCRASAPANTAASSRSRGTSSSGQWRSARRVPTTRVPATEPPTTSGTRTAERVPRRSRVCRSTAASSGRSPRRRESDDVPLAELGHDPRRRVAPDHLAEGRHALSGPGVCGPDLVGRGGERSHGGPVGAQILDQAPETGLDLPVHLRYGAGGEHGGQVGEERLEAQALGDGALDAPAQSTVHEECRDQRALQQSSAATPRISHRWRSHTDGSWNRTTLPEGSAPDVEPPAMELTPVHHHRGGADVGRVRPLPREDTERQPGARPSVRLEAHHVAAHAPGAHGVVLEHVDGHARGAGNSRDRVAGVEVLARRVTQKGADQDDRVLRQRCDLLRDLLDRAAREVADLDSVAVGRELLACRRQPGEIGGCRPRHHDGARRVSGGRRRRAPRLGPGAARCA